MKNCRGFSLVELLVVLAVLSILCCISYPSLAGMSSRAKLKGEAMGLAGLLQKAKLEAVKFNAPVVVELQRENYRIFCDNSRFKGYYGDWNQQEGEPLLAVHEFSEGIHMTSNFSQGKLRFNNTAGVKAGTIKISDSDGQEIRIVLNSVGRIRVEN